MPSHAVFLIGCANLLLRFLLLLPLPRLSFRYTWLRKNTSPDLAQPVLQWTAPNLDLPFASGVIPHSQPGVVIGRSR